MGNANGGLLLSYPVPHAGRIFLSHLSPISISPSGICAFNLQTLPSEARSPYQSGEFLAFNKIKDAGSDGTYLIINKEKFTKCATAKQARALARLVSSLAKTFGSRRENMARTWVVKQFAVDEAAAVLQESEKLIKPIQQMGVILFLFLFALTPSFAFTYGSAPLIIPVAVVMVALAVEIAIMFHRARSEERREG